MRQNIQRKSVPDKVLEATYQALRRWEKGSALQDLTYPVKHREIVTNLVFTIFRHKAVVDWTIIQLCRRPKIDRRLRHILQVGVTQILYMDGIAPATVTDTCVRFTTKIAGPKRAGFVNAVLRNIIRKGRDNWLATVSQKAPPATRLDLAPALYKQWQKHLPPEKIVELASVLNKPAPLVVKRRIASRPNRHAEEADCLAPVEAPDWMPEAQLFICRNPQTFIRSETFRSGSYYIQDPATLLAPVMLTPRPKETLADLCAAPGGKTLVLDEIAADDCILIAGDRSPARLSKLTDNLGTESHIIPVAGDAAIPYCRAASVDAVLLDVPCSNTGVIRRRPDAMWRFSGRQLQELVALQARILDGAAALLKPGGRIVYSTCSIEPEENSEQVRRFCHRHYPHYEIAKERLLFPNKTHDGAYSALIRLKEKR